MNPPSQFIIGYHWIAFLNRVRKNLCSRNLHENFVEQKKFKKTENCFATLFKTLHIFWTKRKFGHFWRMGGEVCMSVSRTGPRRFPRVCPSFIDLAVLPLASPSPTMGAIPLPYDGGNCPPYDGGNSPPYDGGKSPTLRGGQLPSVRWGQLPSLRWG